jgi:hypothetical protein
MCSDSIFNDDYKAIRMKKCGGNQEKFMKCLQLLWMSHTKLVISYASQYKRTLQLVNDNIEKILLKSVNNYTH